MKDLLAFEIVESKSSASVTIIRRFVIFITRVQQFHSSFSHDKWFSMYDERKC